MVADDARAALLGAICGARSLFALNELLSVNRFWLRLGVLGYHTV